MKLSEEMAVRLHRMMWRDMQRDLGDMPNGEERIEYKERWIKKHFPDAKVQSSCFLCEFTHTPHSGALQCTDCPIKWPYSSCTTDSMHYQSAPISKILALPARNEYLARLDDAKVVVDSCSYYKFREEKLSKASGLPASAAIVDHVTKIQEKAVEKYFEERPGAKLATMDVDDAFKQYAKEQMEPLKQMNDRLTKRHIAVKDYLAKQSGLDHDRPVDDHIREIVKNSMEAGAAEERDRIQEKIYEVLLS